MTLPFIPGIEKLTMGLQNFCNSDGVNQSLLCGLYEVAHETGVLGFFPYSGALSREND